MIYKLPASQGMKIRVQFWLGNVSKFRLSKLPCFKRKKKVLIITIVIPSWDAVYGFLFYTKHSLDSIAWCVRPVQKGCNQPLTSLSELSPCASITTIQHSLSIVLRLCGLGQAFLSRNCLPFNVCQQTSRPFLMYTVSESLDGSNLSFLCQGNHHT